MEQSYAKNALSTSCIKPIFLPDRAVKCGKCNFCLNRRRMDWSFRLLQEDKVSSSAYFITLTYNKQHVPYYWEDDHALGYTLDKHDLWKFHKAMRVANQRAGSKETQRYFSTGEYGTLGRPHYHSVFFNALPETIEKLADGKIWGKGNVYIGTVTMASVAYVTKYIVDGWKNEFNEDPRQRPFNVMSRNPGLGENYLHSNRSWHREKDDHNPENFRMYVINNGRKQAMPRYYKDRVFKFADDIIEDIMPTSLELHYMELADKFEKEYIQEIERLSAFQDNPVEYYNQRIIHNHDKIRIKSKALSKL